MIVFPVLIPDQKFLFPGTGREITKCHGKGRDRKFEACIPGNHGKREFPLTPDVDSVTVSVFTIWIFTMVKQEKRDPKELSETSWLFSLEIDQNDADDVLYVWFNHILCRKIKTLLLFMASIEQRKEPQSLPIQNKPLFIPHSYAPSIFQFHCTLYMCSVHYENDWKSTCGAGCPPAHCGPTQPLFLLLCPVCQPRVLQSGARFLKYEFFYLIQYQSCFILNRTQHIVMASDFMSRAVYMSVGVRSPARRFLLRWPCPSTKGRLGMLAAPRALAKACNTEACRFSSRLILNPFYL